ncbi:hypothetical protein ALC60_01969 [Trachymyrmex zeteki]|uniref:Uncharacterized protein n=1 Tax=Mycetomoellerius zeteki TaxID=64791 RepID=A0A151XF77_9HYME|nr:hypothetical protein ALC60_01969 [Trachymyrmex zeteki]
MGKRFANVDPLSSWRFSKCAEYAKLTDNTCTDVGVLEVYKNSDTRAGTVDKTTEIGKTAETSLKQKRDEEAEEEEEEVIRNTVREYNTTSTSE